MLFQICHCEKIVAPTPLGMLVDAATRGVLYRITSATKLSSPPPDCAASVPLANSQNNSRSITLKTAQEKLHGLVMDSVLKTFIYGVIHKSLDERIESRKQVLKAPVIVDGRGSFRQDQQLHESTLHGDVPPGFDRVSASFICNYCSVWSLLVLHRERLVFFGTDSMSMRNGSP